MIFICTRREKIEYYPINIAEVSLLKEAIWIDLVSPSKEEELLIEKYLEMDIPTLEEMQEIELSNRFYRNGQTIFMTASMIAQSHLPDFKMGPVTFILTPQQLLTIRYINPYAFQSFISHLPHLGFSGYNAIDFMLGLLDAIVDNLADILELIGQRLENSSGKIFHSSPDKSDTKLDYKKILQDIGGSGDINTKVNESLVSFNLLITYFEQTKNLTIPKEKQVKLLTLNKDIIALSGHTHFLSTKVNFLLDATLGMINIDQNNIIKIFSVAAVIFLPPTLIASIYGMNFHFMPELSWKWGYLCAIALMVLSAWLPYKYFKYRRWL